MNLDLLPRSRWGGVVPPPKVAHMSGQHDQQRHGDRTRRVADVRVGDRIQSHGMSEPATVTRIERVEVPRIEPPEQAMERRKRGLLEHDDPDFYPPEIPPPTEWLRLSLDGAYDEVTLPPDDEVRLAHLPGQHDQKSHGNRGGASRLSVDEMKAALNEKFVLMEIDIQLDGATDQQFDQASGMVAGLTEMASEYPVVARGLDKLKIETGDRIHGLYEPNKNSLTLWTGSRGGEDVAPVIPNLAADDLSVGRAVGIHESGHMVDIYAVVHSFPGDYPDPRLGLIDKRAKRGTAFSDQSAAPPTSTGSVLATANGWEWFAENFTAAKTGLAPTDDGFDEMLDALTSEYGATAAAVEVPAGLVIDDDFVGSLVWNAARTAHLAGRHDQKAHGRRGVQHGLSPLPYNHPYEVERLSIVDPTAPVETRDPYFKPEGYEQRTSGGVFAERGDSYVHVPGPEPHTVAFLDYHRDPSWGDESHLAIDYVAARSDVEGGGMGLSLIRRLYRENPDSVIDWGAIYDSSAWRMYQQFRETYPEQTGRGKNYAALATVGGPILAHLAGRHDQKSHGRRGGGLSHGEYEVTPQTDPDILYREWAPYSGCTETRVAAEILLGSEPEPTAFDSPTDRRRETSLWDTIEQLQSGEKDYRPDGRLTQAANDAQIALDDAAGMLQLIRDDSSPWDADTMPLYRGMGVDEHDSIMRLSKGDEFDISLGGFTPDKRDATAFQPGGTLSNDYGSPVMFRLTGQVRSFNAPAGHETSVETKPGNWQSAPWEAVTSGRFRVTGVSEGQSFPRWRLGKNGELIASGADVERIIDIEQVGVFDLDQGGTVVRTAALGPRYERPDFDWAFGWPIRPSDERVAHLRGRHDQKSHGYRHGVSTIAQPDATAAAATSAEVSEMLSDFYASGEFDERIGEITDIMDGEADRDPRTEDAEGRIMDALPYAQADLRAMRPELAEDAADAIEDFAAEYPDAAANIALVTLSPGRDMDPDATVSSTLNDVVEGPDGDLAPVISIQFNADIYAVEPTAVVRLRSRADGEGGWHPYTDHRSTITHELGHVLDYNAYVNKRGRSGLEGLDHEAFVSDFTHGDYLDSKPQRGSAFQKALREYVPSNGTRAEPSGMGYALDTASTGNNLSEFRAEAFVNHKNGVEQPWPDTDAMVREIIAASEGPQAASVAPRVAAVAWPSEGLWVQPPEGSVPICTGMPHMPWMPRVAHLQGHHDQKTHGRRGGVGNMPAFDDRPEWHDVDWTTHLMTPAAGCENMTQFQKDKIEEARVRKGLPTDREMAARAEVLLKEGYNDQATYEKYADWYEEQAVNIEDARQQLNEQGRAEMGDQWVDVTESQMIGAVAGSSPRVPWDTKAGKLENIARAKRYLLDYQKARILNPDFDGMNMGAQLKWSKENGVWMGLPSHAKNIAAVMHSDGTPLGVHSALGGAKVRAFDAQFELGGKGPNACIDSLMGQALTGMSASEWDADHSRITQPSGPGTTREAKAQRASWVPGGTTYSIFDSAVRSVAEAHGLDLGDAQALIWGAFRGY